MFGLTLTVLYGCDNNYVELLFAGTFQVFVVVLSFISRNFVVVCLFK